MPVKNMMTAGTAIKIRRAVADDAPCIASLLYEAFEEYKPRYTKQGFEATTATEQEIKERIGQKGVWLALSGEKIVGTVTLFPRHGELFIRSMAVARSMQGKGIGKILMQHVHEMAYSKGCALISLNTTPFLSQAIRLYESFGFIVEGTGDLHGTPLIRMRKNLTPVMRDQSVENAKAI